MIRVFCLLLCCACLVPVVQAQSPVPSEQTRSEAEIRAKVATIARTLRCVECQGQSVAESPSELATDIKTFVEKRVREGRTGDEIREELREAYKSDAILMRTPLQWNTLLLWVMPVLLVAGAGLWFVSARKGKPSSEDAPPLSETDRQRVLAALDRQTRIGADD